jgi:hypothetical protein
MPDVKEPGPIYINQHEKVVDILHYIFHAPHPVETADQLFLVVYWNTATIPASQRLPTPEQLKKSIYGDLIVPRELARTIPITIRVSNNTLALLGYPVTGIPIRKDQWFSKEEVLRRARLYAYIEPLMRSAEAVWLAAKGMNLWGTITEMGSDPHLDYSKLPMQPFYFDNHTYEISKINVISGSLNK